MVITFDVGNSNIVISIFDSDKIIRTLRIKTDIEKSADEYATSIKDLLDKTEIDTSLINGGIISSVVPPLNGVLKGVIKRLFTFEPMFLETGIKTGLKIVCDNPGEVGADLIADSVGALTRYGKGTIVIDLGTASKFIIVDKNGAFSGVIIAPGIKTSKNALVSKTSQLPNISMQAPEKVIGRNTIDAMNSGVAYGYASMVDGLISRIEEELGYKCNHVLTGGLSKVVNDSLKEEVVLDRDLISYGLLAIYNKNRGK